MINQDEVQIGFYWATIMSINGQPSPLDIVRVTENEKDDDLIVHMTTYDHHWSLDEWDFIERLEPPYALVEDTKEKE